MSRETIGSDDDLLVALIEIIEDVEKFFLRFFLADDELEVVDDETVEFFIFITELFAATFLDALDEFGIEI